MMGGPGGPGGHRMEMRMQKQLDELHGQLKLNADQEKLWQTALTTMKQNHQAMRDAHKQSTTSSSRRRTSRSST